MGDFVARGSGTNLILVKVRDFLKKLKLLILTALTLFIIIIGTLFIIASSPSSEDTLITIEKNASGRDVATLLSQEGVIRSAD
ncbi:MAG: endolytic transglycosylase MltG, partial [Alphaproteobacteria bacterium]|nr:endolytic transglycosylase MltG [Alphaproteobacteria bacterium]